MLYTIYTANGKSQSHSRAHVRMRLHPSINRSFVYKAKEGRHVRIIFIYIKVSNTISISDDDFVV